MTTYTYSTFLTLVNAVLAELNEVQLTQGSFANAVGFQIVARNAVNKAVRHIQHQQWEWPFNHTYGTQTLSSGVSVYALPSDTKSVDWNTFFLQYAPNFTTPTEATALPLVPYTEYIQNYKAQDSMDQSSEWAPPRCVIRSPNDEFIVSPYPDQAYVIEFDYWSNYTEMVNYNDTCSIPSRFDRTIIDGAMYYCYKFRENLAAASDSEQALKDGIAEMRNIYVDNYIQLTDKRAGPQFRTRM